MNKRYILTLRIVVIGLWICSTTIFRDNLSESIRFINDNADRGDYYKRGMWLVNQSVPYRDVFSEYPQIPTWLFGIVHIPFLNQTDNNVARLNYIALFSLLMTGMLIALAEIISRLLAKEKLKYIYFLLLPAPLYFALNRFDVLPATICTLTLFMVNKEKWGYAAVLLALGTFTKWYPALLLFPILIYMQKTNPKPERILKFLILFFATSFLIVLPTYLSGGMNAILAPYLFHNNRGAEILSLPGLIEVILLELTSIHLEQVLNIIFLLLQIIAIPFLFFTRLNTFEKLLNWCLLIITLYILFARIYSPQWILWVFPLLIISSRDKIDIGLIWIYGIVTYIGFPLIFDIFGNPSLQMILMGFITNSILLAIAIETGRHLVLLSRTENTPAALEI